MAAGVNGDVMKLWVAANQSEDSILSGDKSTIYSRKSLRPVMNLIRMICITNCWSDQHRDTIEYVSLQTRGGGGSD